SILARMGIYSRCRWECQDEKRGRAMKDIIPDTGSFRDKSNRVFYQNQRVYRALDGPALNQWNRLASKRFFGRLCREGKVIATRLSSDASLDSWIKPSWAGVLQHEAVPFISYAYEWTFSMVKDAALLHLE